MKALAVVCGLALAAALTTADPSASLTTPDADRGSEILHSTNIDDDIFAPGAPTRAGDLPEIATTAPTFATAQAVSVGGAIQWAEAISSAGDVPGAAEADDALGASIVIADFTDDGIADLVTGAPGEAIGSLAGAGAIILIPGGVREFQIDPLSYDPEPAEFYSQSGPMAGAAEAGDEFGAALAAGDFNNDGIAELVVGAPGEAIGSINDAGSITVVPSNIFGLQANLSYTYSQSSTNVPGASETDDRFGSALAVGNFNNDNYDDLVVGAPGEDIGSNTDAGAIVIFYGGPSGLSTSGSTAFHQDTPGVAGVAEAGDMFGHAVATGDINNDNYDDVIIGVPGEDIGGATNVGAIAILYGSASGITATGDDSYHQATKGVAGASESGDGFGTSVAAGQIDSDNFADVAVGVPGEDIGSISNAGAVAVFYGSSSGLSTTNDKAYHQNSSGVKGVAEANDAFGTAVLLADVVGGTSADLVVGVPGEDIGSTNEAGLIAILPGTTTGITATGDAAISASSTGVPGAAETNDQLGASLAAGDLNGDLTIDLAVGIPGEDIGSINAAGAVLSLDPRPELVPNTTDLADEQTGDQLHIIHAIPADNDPGRAMDAALRVEIAVVDAWYSDQFGGRNLRWDTFGGAIDITTVALSQTEAEIAAGPTQFDIVNLQLALEADGFDATDKAYLVFYEGQGSSANTCGVTFSYEIAVLWLDACGGVYPSYTNFPFGSTYLVVHEMTHLLGAVEDSAPNSCCQGHLDDDNRDVLFQNPNGGTSRDWDNLQLDPGNDDYYQHSGAWPDFEDSEYLQP